MDKRKRSGKITAQQQTIYLDFVKSNRSLRTNKNVPEDPNAIENAWDELTGILNACGDGPQKTKDQWKKTFTDWKSSTKKKARLEHVQQQQTGGGPPSNLLTALEEELINVLGKVVVAGAPGLPEAGIRGSDSPQSPVNRKSLINSNISKSPTPSTSTYLEETPRGIKSPRKNMLKTSLNSALAEYKASQEKQLDVLNKLADNLRDFTNALQNFTTAKIEENYINRKFLKYKMKKMKIKYSEKMSETMSDLESDTD